ncbi:Glucose-6-phosphate isomerase [hydrothermal vent metagenome]|uniref:glucose-6-phosphate isomerase n=1 Tax=hydrothermal vent metagenome TaxID=652676 RepID=A0A3B1CP21_9ZZZZ
MQDIKIDYTNIMAPAVGKENGLIDENFTALSSRADKIHDDLVGRRKSGDKPFYDLPYKIKEAKELIKAADKIKKDFSCMVVLGIGGSALGTTAMLTALGHPMHNSVSSRKRGGVKLFVADNIDPDEFGALLSTLKLKDTVFNVVSKSGSTAETMSQFMIVFDLLKNELGRGWKKHLILTTDAKEGILREIADTYKLKTFVVPDGVGGRFTALTPVCLLPVASAGIDILGMLKGAARMDELCRTGDIRKNPAYLFASIHYLLDTLKGKKMTVMMPYSYRLKDVADWFRQLWAESLGKARDIDGNPVHAGQTPIKALGATDQHSQVQLYVEGPFDKLFCLLEVESFKTEMPIPEMFEDQPGISYLGGQSLNRLIAVEKEGTQYALTTNNRPNMTIKLPEVNAHTLGQLLYMLEVATAFAGGLYRVDAFDQPGVEFGKQYAYAMMGRAGHEKKKTEYESKRTRNRLIV